MAPDPEQLAERVRDRCNRFLGAGERNAVLSPAAADDLAELVRAADGEDSRLEWRHAAGWLYWCRYQALEPDDDEPELAGALAMFAPVYEAQPDSLPDEVREYFASAEDPDAAGARGTELLSRSLTKDDPETLDAAIESLWQAVAGGDPAAVPVYQANLSSALRSRYERGGNDADLDAATALAQEALAAVPAGAPGRGAYVSNLAGALELRFKQRGAVEDADAAIALLRAADDPALLPALGTVLISRARSLGDAAAANEALEVSRRALDLPVADDAGRASRLAGLALALQARYDSAGGDASDLDDAIARLREALELHPAAASSWAHLSAALRARFDTRGALEDVEAAVAAGQRAVEQTVPDDPDAALRATAYGAALRTRFARLGDPDDLDDAISAFERAVAKTPARHPATAVRHSNLDAALQSRFELTGALSDLERAVDAARTAVAAAREGDRDRPGYHSNLANALRLRYWRLGGPADLDEAIDAARASLTDGSRPEIAAKHVANLGLALQTRFERSGGLADIEEAVDALRRAVALAPPGASETPAHWSNLGLALRTWFERTERLEALDEAIAAGRRGVAVAQADHPDRPTILSGLGGALTLHGVVTGSPASLDEGISLERESVALSPAADPQRWSSLSNLGRALLFRFEAQRNEEDLAAAIRALREAADAADPEHPEAGLARANLAQAHQARFELTGAAADATEARRRFADVAHSETAAPSVRAEAAHRAGRIAAGVADWDDAVDLHALAVELLPQLAPRRLSAIDRQHQLLPLAGLAQDAAACCLEAGDPEEAVVLWEYGRGVQLALALSTRAEAELARLRPALADRFARLRDQIDRVSGTPLPSVATARTEPRRERMHKLREEFNTVLAAIRALPGFHRFLKRIAIDDLLVAAERGPVIVLNVSDLRSDGLILQPSGVGVVPLEVTPDAVNERVRHFVAALERSDEAGLRDVLEWLWDAICGPVMAQLAPTRPHLWWCPSGLLSQLPLHAAGYHDTRFDAAPRTVIDRATTSYTTTLRALLQAHEQQEPDVDGAALVVAMPETPAASALPGAAAEAAQLRTRWGKRAEILIGPQAQRTRVEQALTRARWAHFACHAVSDLDDASAGRLLLHDHQTSPLTVAAIAALLADGAQLAFLSACETAHSGERLPDEVIHLASAFQLAGFRHVVATLWPVGDRAALLAARRFYNQMADADAAGPALHDALRALRSLLANRPSCWAAHAHYGP